MQWTDLGGVTPPPDEVTRAHPDLAAEAHRLTNEVLELLEHRQVVEAVFGDPGRRLTERGRLVDVLLEERELRRQIAEHHARVGVAAVQAADEAHAHAAQLRQQVADALAAIGFAAHGDPGVAGMLNRHAGLRAARDNAEALASRARDNAEALANGRGRELLEEQLAAVAQQFTSPAVASAR